jgi:hypothetical protein
MIFFLRVSVKNWIPNLKTSAGCRCAGGFKSGVKGLRDSFYFVERIHKNVLFYLQKSGPLSLSNGTKQPGSILLLLPHDSSRSLLSATSCISSMHQTMDNAQHNILIMDPTLPQTFKESIICATFLSSLCYTLRKWSHHLKLFLAMEKQAAAECNK